MFHNVSKCINELLQIVVPNIYKLSVSKLAFLSVTFLASFVNVCKFKSISCSVFVKKGFAGQMVIRNQKTLFFTIVSESSHAI